MNTRKYFAGLVIASLLTTQTALADFQDVSEFHPNKEAIDYLEENGVLQGYPDRTFRPYQDVNRAEFLKIIMEGSNISLDGAATSNFSDVPDNQWYTDYVNHAFTQGWINGYQDGTFRPTQTINNAEALKITALVQDWDLQPTTSTEWYAPYQEFADANGLLEKPGDQFVATELMTRGSISEVIYRSATQLESTPENEEPNQEQEEEEEEEETPTTEDPTTDEPTYFAYSKTYFDNITLDQEIPNTFYQNEVYLFSGRINQSGFSQSTIFISDPNTQEDLSIFYDEALENNRFETAVYFPEAGEYDIAIIPGTRANTKIATINVVENLPASNNTESTEKATSVRMDYEDQQTFVEFNAPSTSVKRITFEQGSRDHTYISRQNLDAIPVNYTDFEDFSEGRVSVIIETAETSSLQPLKITSSFEESTEKTFTATEHTFADTSPSEISTTVPDTVSTSSNITFNATAKTDIKERAYVITPDGQVESFLLSTTGTKDTYFGSPIIKSGSVLTFDYDPQETGRHIIEINNREGIAVVNYPVYVGSPVPLIPDFNDLNQRELSTSNISLLSSRNEMLDLINEARQEHGAEPIQLRNDLNDLAQDHANDMSNNSYFSHINLFNQTPEDRRIDAGITTPVTENIARDVSVEFAHYGLMRSAAHRSAILDPSYTHVGIGLKKNSEGFLYVAQEYSTEELTTEILEGYEAEAIQEINKLRTENNLSALSEQNNLNDASEYINDQNINNNQDLDNDLFLESLNENEVFGTSQAVIRIFSSWPTILETTLEEKDEITDEFVFLQENWQNIGLDVTTTATGLIQSIIIINY